MVTDPHAIDRLIEDELCGLHMGVSLGMDVPGAHEHAVEAVPIAGLPDDLISDGAGVRVIDGPSPAWSLAGKLPGIVVADAAPGERRRVLQRNG